MSNPTTPFGWQMPTATDLVTDLPADFEVFGQAVATSMADLLGGTTGQVLSKNSNTDMDFVWVTDAAGDITGVTAGTGITGGGTSGSVTVSFDQTNFGGGQLAAGKNKVINGDFSINQRAFTSTTTEFVYGVDRFFMRATGGTNTYSVQAFTAGEAPTTQIAGKNYVRLVSSGQSGTGDRTILRTYIENARTLANQTVTISFYAKAATGTPNICPSIFISYGTGGSPSANLDWNLTTKQTITTSWARYTFTGTMPSLTGKTFGTNNNDYIALDIAVSAGSTLTQFNGIGLQSNTFDIWGLQLEAGSASTPFQTASGGNPQAELAMCQRYYVRWNGANSFNHAGTGVTTSATNAYIYVNPPVEMRVAPTAIDYATMALYNYVPNVYAISALVFNSATTKTCQLYATSTGMTANHFVSLCTNSSSAGYVGLSAEL